MLARQSIRRVSQEERAARGRRRAARLAFRSELDVLVRPDVAAEPELAPQRAHPRLAFIRTRQPCRVAVVFGRAAGRCRGGIEVEHQREGVGMGQRADHALTYGICRRHHMDRHDGRGVFRDMPRPDLRAFVREAIAACDLDFAAYPAEAEPQPGDPVVLGGREGAVVDVDRAARTMRVRWIDGELTTEPLPDPPP